MSSSNCCFLNCTQISQKAGQVAWYSHLFQNKVESPEINLLTYGQLIWQRRQEYWSGLPFPSPGDLPDPGIKPRSPLLQADSLLSEPPGKPIIAFRKGRGTRDQIANICWIIEKARDFQKNIYFCFIDYAKAFDCVDHNKLWKILKEMGIPDLPLEKFVCRSGSNH